MYRLLRDIRYTYDDPFGNEHTYLFSHGGADIHPDNLTPTIETCQASFTATPGSDDMNSLTPAHRQTPILNMQDLHILHSNNIYHQNNKVDFKVNTHLHGIDMQIHSIPKPPSQKAQDMELSDLHHEEFKILTMEYNRPQQEPHNELDHFVNTLQQHLDPTFYAMQMQNPDVLTHAQMKRQVDTNKFVISGLMDINTLEFIPKTALPPIKRYLDLIWTYRRKHCPYGSLKKYKARLCVNGTRQIQGIDYTESFTPIVQWSTIRMVNTLAAMHNLKGKKIDFTQSFPKAKLKEDIYLRFPAGFEHKHENWH
jgi:hypothetical protein